MQRVFYLNPLSLCSGWLHQPRAKAKHSSSPPDRTHSITVDSWIPSSSPRGNLARAMWCRHRAVLTLTDGSKPHGSRAFGPTAAPERKKRRAPLLDHSWRTMIVIPVRRNNGIGRRGGGLRPLPRDAASPQPQRPKSLLAYASCSHVAIALPEVATG